MKPSTTVIAALVLLSAAACGRPADGRFDAQVGVSAPTCQVHQTEQPGHRYTGGTHADTRSILQMMRYYTANGTKPYCDGKPATEVDRQWRTLYTALGGDQSHLTAAPSTQAAPPAG